MTDIFAKHSSRRHKEIIFKVKSKQSKQINKSDNNATNKDIWNVVCKLQWLPPRDGTNFSALRSYVHRVHRSLLGFRRHILWSHTAPSFFIQSFTCAFLQTIKATKTLPPQRTSNKAEREFHNNEFIQPLCALRHHNILFQWQDDTLMGL